MNTVDLAKPYVVDVFRVTGGTTHDYNVSMARFSEPKLAMHFSARDQQQSVSMLEGSETWDPPMTCRITASGAT